MFPDFVIIGVQRGGTTSLYRYLTKHPKIIPALKKEVHFFDLNFSKGTGWYESQFMQNFIFNLWHKKKLYQDTIRGEASPYYFYHPHVPKRLSKLLQKVKLILILRDPVERALSHYHHERKLGVEHLSFDDAIKEEPNRLKGEYEKILEDKNYYSFNHQHFSYVDRGLYLEQFKKWEKFFHKDQILILSSEEFYADPNNICNKVFHFMNLNNFSLDKIKTYNKGKYKTINNDTMKRLTEFFAPHNEEIYDYLKRDFNWRR